MIAWPRLRGSWLGWTVLFFLPLIVGMLFAGPARAQGEPQVTVRASATVVEAGEPFSIELKALVEHGQPVPYDPELKAGRQFEVVGPHVSQQTFAQFGSGGPSVKVGIGATWQLTASKPGRYTINAPSVRWNAKRLRGTSVTIDVKPSSGRPRRQQNNPFLMPGGPGFGFPFGGRATIPDDDDSDVGAAPELGMAKAPDPVVFVRAMVDKKEVVIGEQVTLSFYIYSRQQLPLADWHEAPLPDFVRVPLLTNPGTEPHRNAMVGGHRYLVRLFDRRAIFPTRAGELHTGSLRLNFVGRRVVGDGQRLSEDLVIRVTEPPRAGRPPGYPIGNVGSFTLTAAVQPKRVDQGGAVSVTLRLSGTGNLPPSLRVPERVGVEWLDPEKKESIEPVNGVVGGWKTFGYVVRVKNSGSVDLGEVELPYWDPAAKEYRIAKAVLGAIEVRPTSPAPDPSAKPSAPGAPSSEPFAALAGPRSTLGAYTPRKRPLLEGGSLWLLIAAPPLMVGLFSAGSSALRRARARSASSKEAPSFLATAALDEAAAAEKSGDIKALTASLERAIHLAIEGATALKSRGVLLSELAAELERRGVAPALAADVEGALAACDVIRYEPATGGSATEGARDLAARARAIVAELGRRRAP